MDHIRRQRKRFSFYAKICLAVIILFSLSFPAISKALSQTPSGDYYQVRSIELTELGISHPVGLAYSPQVGELLVLEDPATWIAPGAPLLKKITLRGLPAGSITPNVNITDPLNVAFDQQTNNLFVLDQTAQEMIGLQVNPGGPSQMSALFDASSYSVQSPAGIAFDPQNGSLFILDAAGPAVVRIIPHPVLSLDGPAALRDGRINQINLGTPAGETLRGLAYNPNNGHLYTINPTEKKMIEVTETGQVVATFDLSELTLADPQAMVFAPSGDSTDDPAAFNLYIADSGQSSSQSTISSIGQIIELALEGPDALPPGTPLLPATLVRVVDTSNAAWNPSAPDTSGIAYRPATGRFVVVDSEVEEMPPYWAGANVFDATTSGTLISTCTTSQAGSTNGAWNNFSNEPTGVAVNPINNHLFISDDSGGGKVHEVSPGADGVYCTPDDVVVTISFDTDVEDVAYGNNMLFIAGGIDAEIWMWSLGPNGVLGGGDDGAVTHFDTDAMGLRDVEGVAYNSDAGTLFVISTANDPYIGEATTAGTLLRGYDLDFMGSGAGLHSGITYAPASQNPAFKNIYIVSRGVDNGSNPNENDGRWWEISIGSVAPSITPGPSPTSTNTPTRTPTGTAGPSPTPTNTPTVTSTASSPPTVSNLLANPGFEIDANGDGSPDSWGTNTIFSRSNELLRSGNFVGKLSATNSASANILNTVDNLTAGTTYEISGWVNIPQLSGSSLDFKLKVEWRNGSTLIVRDTIKKYSAMTSGWDQALASLVAPAGTNNARVLLALSGLNGTIYLDDFVFGLPGASASATPTATATNTATATATGTATPSPTSTNTATATATGTTTMTPTATNTATATATATGTSTPTATATSTGTVTTTPTATNTATGTATQTATATATGTTTTTPTATNTATGTATQTATATTTPTSTGTATPSATSTPAAPDLIFEDGFETGNFSAWTAERDTEGDLNVLPAAALQGASGMAALIDNTTIMYVTDDSPISEARYRARFYFDPNSLTMANNDSHSIFAARSNTADPLRIDLRRQPGLYQIRAFVGNDTGAITTAWFTISDDPHSIEIDWSAATGVGANDGSFTMWIDGAVVATLTGLDNDTLRIEQARLGPYVGIDPGTSGTEYFDAFVSRRQTYIGP